jgi:hypothetical protein
MGATSRDNYRTKRGRKAKGPPFVQLHYFLLDSAAWHSLSVYARCAYIELARLYDGLNNGTLALSVRRLAEAISCNKDTAAKALTELEVKGFIACEKVGQFTRKERHSTEYRLTAYRCDVTGETATREFNPGEKWLPSRSDETGQSVRRSRTDATANPQSVRPDRTDSPLSKGESVR